jgi:predicted amino acid-binding ACT domain protein
MALKVTKVDVWAGDVIDAPGGLADVLEKLAGGGESIEFLIARRSDKHVRIGKVFVTPVTSSKAKEAAGRAALRRAIKLYTLRIEGGDQQGLGAKLTRAIADAGINAKGVSAAVIGNKFVAYISFDSEADADNAMAAVKRVRDGGAPRKRAAGGGKSAASKRKAPAARRKPAPRARARAVGR